MTGEESSKDNDWSRYLFSAELAEMLPHLELGDSLGEDKGVTQLIAQHKQKKQGYSNKVFLRMLSKSSLRIPYHREAHALMNLRCPGVAAGLRLITHT